MEVSGEERAYITNSYKHDGGEWVIIKQIVNSWTS